VPRRECFGELLQLDGSHHAWFGAEQAHSCLMNWVDDATGTTLALLAKVSKGIKKYFSQTISQKVAKLKLPRG
jgi:hypothetical protein